MKIGLIKNNQGSFIPAHNSDWEKAKKIKQGELRRYEVKKERNPMHHRKLFAFFRLMLHYLPEHKKEKAFEKGFRFNNEEDVLFYMKIKMGHIRNRAVTAKGNIVYDTASISFSKMGQDEFTAFYNKCIDIGLALIEATRELIERELMDFM